MIIKDVYMALDSIAPFHIAESWDNVGLLVGDMEEYVEGILLALDITELVIQEALSKKANLIITHHPIIFSPLRTISSSGLISQLIHNKINVISAHTNLDMVHNGVNTSLANQIELHNLKPLYTAHRTPHYKVIVFTPRSHTGKIYSNMVEAGAGTLGNYTGAGFIGTGQGRFKPEKNANPSIGNVGNLENVEEDKLELLVSKRNLNSVVRALKKSHPYEEPAYDIFKNYAVTDDYSLGCIGKLDQPMSGEEFANHVKNKLEASNVRYTNPENMVLSVAVCSGSGGGFLQQALGENVDAFVTGEIKHHQILEADAAGITLVDSGHFSTENIFMEPLKKELLKILPDIKIHTSDKCTDGIYAL